MKRSTVSQSLSFDLVPSSGLSLSKGVANADLWEILECRKNRNKQLILQGMHGPKSTPPAAERSHRASREPCGQRRASGLRIAAEQLSYPAPNGSLPLGQDQTGTACWTPLQAPQACGQPGHPQRGHNHVIKDTLGMTEAI